MAIPKCPDQEQLGNKIHIIMVLVIRTAKITLEKQTLAIKDKKWVHDPVQHV